MVFGALGLSAESTQVYRVLVARPDASAADLAEASGMSAVAVGRLLSALVEEGLALRLSGRPPRYRAEAPDVAVSALIQRREEELHSARVEVRRLADAHREAVRLGSQDMAVTLLGSPEDISTVVQRLTERARIQLRAFDTPPYVDRPGSGLDAQVMRQRRGVAHRVIYSEQAVAWPGRMQGDIVPSVRSGEQARVSPVVPLKLLLVDHEAAVLPFSTAPGGQQAAYLVRASPLLVALEALFEAQWVRSTPLLVEAGSGGVGPDGAVQPDEETRTLVRMLASGMSDAAVMRAMEWSERTTQRRIQRLMTRLDASTRFQAAVEATRRQWL